MHPFRRMTTLSPPSLFMLLVAAPILEELAFRGAVQEWMLRRLDRRSPGPLITSSPRWTANAATAVLFSLAHAMHRGAWLGVTVLPAGLLLGLIYERTRRIIPCIVVHAGLNAAWILLATFAMPQRVTGF